jgi:anti-sigma regulatory factor (Ser/Thr protein kinase)
MTSEEPKREIYLGSARWEAERVNAAVLARMERIAEVRIAVGEIEAARYAAEAKAMTKKEGYGK